MFEIEFTESARDDFAFFDKHEQTIIVNGIENQLFWQPQIATRNRKPLRPNALAQWELRVAKYRIFYDIASEPRTVKIKALGWKKHNRLFIRGREFAL